MPPHPLLRRPLLHCFLPLLALLLLITTSYHLRSDPLTGFLVSSPSSPSSASAVCPDPSSQREVLWPPRRRKTDEQLRYLLLPSSLPPPPGPAIRPLPTLPAQCLEPWIAHGLPCHIPTPPITADLVWTWVNGSDPLQLSSSILAQTQSGATAAKGKIISQSKQFRENGELLYSVRSAVGSVGAWVGKAHLLVADYNLTSCSAPTYRDVNDTLHTLSVPSSRMAQLPQWLKPLRQPSERWLEPGKGRGEGVELRVVSHWELGLREPVFDSFAIEAALPQTPGLAEYFVYLNDDYFLLLPLPSSAFFSLPYGPVFRFQPDLLVRGNPSPLSSVSGEWGALEFSNYLLDRRFGERGRPYVIHVAKAMARPLVEELQLLWAGEVGGTREHAFRSSGDVHLGFLFPHFTIERHREALLWSYVIARVGGEGDEWGEEQMERAWRELGGGEGEEFYGDLEVWREGRGTLVPGRVEKVLGGETGGTKYEFSSHDGYPYKIPNLASKSFPTFPLPSALRHSEPNAPQTPPACVLEFELCLGTDGESSTSASEVFKRVAFERPACGDCLIIALVGQSGELGLSAFLPERKPDEKDEELPEALVPMLPLTTSWQDADFSLHAVLPPSHRRPSLRSFCVSLLARYTYTLGTTPVRFSSLRTQISTKQVLRKLDQDRDISMVCLNDDIVSREREVKELVGQWMGRKWGRALAWEKGGGGWW